MGTLPGSQVEGGTSPYPEDYIGALVEERPETIELANFLKEIPPEARARLIQTAHWIAKDALTLAGADISLERGAGVRLLADTLARILDVTTSEMWQAEQDIFDRLHLSDSVMREIGIKNPEI